MDAPSLDKDLSLAQAVEQLTVQQLVPEPGIEAFTVTVFPCTARQGIAWRCPERGDPGSIKVVLVPTAAIQSRTF